MSRESVVTFAHREMGARFLRGEGLEIGALHQPAKVPAHCSVRYLDVDRVESIRALFPEVNGSDIGEVDYVGDVTRQSILDITNRMFDFILLNHVLEHVADPIRVIQHVWEGINEGGCFVLSVPDKCASFDRGRPLTSYEHLLAEYWLGASEACDDHYVEFLAHVHPEAFADRGSFLAALDHVRRRREHVHVWTSSSFKRHLVKITGLLDMQAGFLFESDVADNGFEYFAVLRKIAGEPGASPPAAAGERSTSAMPYEPELDLPPEERVERLQAALAETKARLRVVLESRTWRTVSTCLAIRDRLLPEGTQRRRRYQSLVGWLDAAVRIVRSRLACRRRTPTD